MKRKSENEAGQVESPKKDDATLVQPIALKQLDPLLDKNLNSIATVKDPTISF